MAPKTQLVCLNLWLNSLKISALSAFLYYLMSVDNKPHVKVSVGKNVSRAPEQLSSSPPNSFCVFWFALAGGTLCKSDKPSIKSSDLNPKPWSATLYKPETFY